jgi:hypothetical protein
MYLDGKNRAVLSSHLNKFLAKVPGSNSALRLATKPPHIVWLLTLTEIQ